MTMMKKCYLMPVVIGACIAIGAGTQPGPEALAASNEDCIGCENQPGCPAGYHDAWEGGPGSWDRAGGAHLSEPYCWSGSCQTKHGPCDLEGELTTAALDALTASIAAQDIDGIGEFLDAHARQVAVNAARSAMQLKGCTGGVIAHLPMSGDLISAVAALHEEALDAAAVK